jgi:hypothetical protein
MASMSAQSDHLTRHELYMKEQGRIGLPAALQLKSNQSFQGKELSLSSF